MLTFVKAQAASFAASLIDYTVTIVSVELLNFWYVAASATGTIAGGVTNFSMGRRWVFRRSDAAKHRQAMRYLLVWMGYWLLATAGVYGLTHLGRFNYIVSKITVTLFLAVAYNYPLQKRFVFR